MSPVGIPWVKVGRHIGAGEPQWLPWDPLDLRRKMPEMAIQWNYSIYFLHEWLNCLASDHAPLDLLTCVLSSKLLGLFSECIGNSKAYYAFMVLHETLTIFVCFLMTPRQRSNSCHPTVNDRRSQQGCHRWILHATRLLQGMHKGYWNFMVHCLRLKT